MRLSEKLRTWARRIKRDGVTLWFACKHPDTPLIAKLLGVLVLAYALSPIDLIPDFIPVLGYLDEVILLPVLIWIAVKLLPSAVLEDCRIKAADWMEKEGRKPRNNWGILLVLATWILIAWALWTYVAAPWAETCITSEKPK